MHADAAIINAIGRERVQSHFNVTLRTIQLWSKHGIPKIHRNSFEALRASVVA